MSWFGEPTLSYSHDGGKTWRTDGPLIGPGTLVRVMTPEGKQVWIGHAHETEIECRTCYGTGKEKVYRYVEDK